MTHIKIPKDRIGAIIGPKGETKKTIEEKSSSRLDIDSETGTVEIIGMEDPLGAFRAGEVVKAISRGFNPEKALRLFEDDMLMLEVIDLSKVAGTQKELIRLKGRIIGKAGKTRELAESLIGVKISVYGKTVSILGYPEQNRIVQAAIEMLMEGVNHGTVYSFLEKKHREMMQSQLDYY
jgi:ribosomal RNA assembly protein